MKSLSPRIVRQILTATVALTAAAAAEGTLKVVENETTIVLTHDGSPFLTYHKAEVSPPKGVDPVFKRSGFIHPLKTPG